MGILGDVNNGWFATLSHGCEDFSRGTLNFISCGNQWGDKLYGTMNNVVTNQVETINQNAINQAIGGGATPIQALQAGSARMDQLANPQNAGDLWELAKTGASSSWETVKTLANNAVGTDAGAALLPLLIGAGVVGGAYLIGDNMSSNESLPARRRDRERTA